MRHLSLKKNQKNMKNIVVIGAGTMGNGIAHTFAQTGLKYSTFRP